MTTLANEPSRYLDKAYGTLKFDPQGTQQVLSAAAQGQGVGLQGLAAMMAQRFQQNIQPPGEAPSQTVLQQLLQKQFGGGLAQMLPGAQAQLQQAPQQAPQSPTQGLDDIPPTNDVLPTGMAVGGLVSLYDGGNVPGYKRGAYVDMPDDPDDDEIEREIEEEYNAGPLPGFTIEGTLDALTRRKNAIAEEQDAIRLNKEAAEKSKSMDYYTTTQPSPSKLKELALTSGASTPVTTPETSGLGSLIGGEFDTLGTTFKDKLFGDNPINDAIRNTPAPKQSYDSTSASPGKIEAETVPENEPKIEVNPRAEPDPQARVTTQEFAAQAGVPGETPRGEDVISGLPSRAEAAFAFGEAAKKGDKATAARMRLVLEEYDKREVAGWSDQTPQYRERPLANPSLQTTTPAQEQGIAQVLPKSAPAERSSIEAELAALRDMLGGEYRMSPEIMAQFEKQLAGAKEDKWLSALTAAASGLVAPAYTTGERMGRAGMLGLSAYQQGARGENAAMEKLLSAQMENDRAGYTASNQAGKALLDLRKEAGQAGAKVDAARIKAAEKRASDEANRAVSLLGIQERSRSGAADRDTRLKIAELRANLAGQGKPMTSTQLAEAVSKVASTIESILEKEEASKGGIGEGAAYAREGREARRAQLVNAFTQGDLAYLRQYLTPYGQNGAGNSDTITGNPARSPAVSVTSSGARRVN